MNLYIFVFPLLFIHIFSAICEPDCANGGVCIAPGVCQCLRGFHGETCQEGKAHLLFPVNPVTHFLKYIDASSHNFTNKYREEI